MKAGQTPMATTISDRDWKRLRELRPALHERYCRRALEEAAALASEASEDPHRQFARLVKLVRRRDRDMGAVFEHPSRKDALMHLCLLRAHGVLGDEEYARFSPQTRAAVDEVVSS